MPANKRTRANKSTPVCQAAAKPITGRASKKQYCAWVLTMVFSVAAGVFLIVAGVEARQPNLAPTVKPAPASAPTPPPASAKTMQAQLEAGQVFQDQLRSGKLAPKMLVIPSGEFLMGSAQTENDRADNEGPQHLVSLKAFAIGQTEVTFEDYDYFAKATGRGLPNDDDWGRGKRPVINVSWQDVQAYIQWLNQQSGKVYRLPSEAEWEFAARAGSTEPFSTGKCLSDQQANFIGGYTYRECPKTNLFPSQTVPVASYPANAFGLYDFHGNVWEWVEDCYHDNYQGAPINGQAWKAGKNCATRVVRGGSWGNMPLNLRSAMRFWNFPSARNHSTGFRLARSL